eukprot:1833106-Rhodomonas_salina.1
MGGQASLSAAKAPLLVKVVCTGLRLACYAAMRCVVLTARSLVPGDQRCTERPPRYRDSALCNCPPTRHARY